MRRESYRDPEKVAKGVFGGFAIIWIVYFAIKVVSIPILVVNVIALIQAVQSDSVGTFDFTWFVLSLVGLIIL